jgi:hypothetical protein
VKGGDNKDKVGDKVVKIESEDIGGRRKVESVLNLKAQS